MSRAAGCIAGLLAMSVAAAAGAAAPLPDPTRPTDYYSTPNVSDLPRRDTVFVVSAIRISEADRSALLNGRIVRVGDVLDAGKVLEINPAEVVVEYERKRVLVPLYSQGVTKTFVKEPSQ